MLRRQAREGRTRVHTADLETITLLVIVTPAKFIMVYILAQ